MKIYNLPKNNSSNSLEIEAAINNLVDSAPAALDTLKEIADQLADDDNAIAALVAVNTSQNTAIAALQATDVQIDSDIINLEEQVHNRVTIDVNSSALNLADQELSLSIDQNVGNFALQVEDGLRVNSNDIELQYLNANLDDFLASNVEEAFYFLAKRNNIRRLNMVGNLSLANEDVARQHLINQTSGNLNVTLPLSPFANQEFEVINNSTSTFNLIFAGETLLPGTRHAVQWDGTEWVIM